MPKKKERDDFPMTAPTPFSTEFTVDIHDVDFNGVARYSSLMRYIQGAAQSQLTANGMSYEQLRERGVAFLLSRIRTEFTAPIRAYQRLRAITYPCDNDGQRFSFLRCYRLETLDGETIGRAVSVWALVNTETHALMRVTDFDLGLPTLAPLDLTLNRFRMPSDLRSVGTYPVLYDDLDQNRHMNNTRYADLYSAFLPMDGMRIDSLTVSYLSEAPMGEVLDVQMAQHDDTYYFRTLRRDGKVNTEAEVHLCPLA